MREEREVVSAAKAGREAKIRNRRIETRNEK